MRSNVTTKGDLAGLFAKKFGFSIKKSKSHIDFIFDTITESLKESADVSISGFGVFKIRSRDITVKTPNMQKAIEINGLKVASFKPSKSLKMAIRDDV